MGNSIKNVVQARENEVVLLFGKFTGANGANPTAVEGIFTSAARDGEGDVDLVLREKFPQAAALFAVATVEGTSGATAHVAALDLHAGTMTVETRIPDGTDGSVADDVDGLVVNVFIAARNSSLTHR